MKNSKRPLRAVLDGLTTAFVDAVLAAARDALTDRDSFFHPRSAPPPSVARPRTAAAKEPRARARQAARPAPAARRESVNEAPLAEASTDLLITDPQALLEALETAGPDEVAQTSRHAGAGEGEAVRALPRLLESNDLDRSPKDEKPEAVPAPPPRRDAVPLLRAREGEEVVRSLGSSVVLRRRRA